MKETQLDVNAVSVRGDDLVRKERWDGMRGKEDGPRWSVSVGIFCTQDPNLSHGSLIYKK